MSGISIDVLVPPEPFHDTKLRPYLDQQTRQLFPHAGDAVAYTCRQQHPDSRHESQTASDDDHHPAVLPRVLLLGHPKVPIGLATALAQLPLGIKAAVTMPAHLMQLSSGADGRVDEHPEDPEHMGEPLSDHKQHHWHHDHSSSSHHAGPRGQPSNSGNQGGVDHKQQHVAPGGVRQPSGIYAAALAADRLQLQPAAGGASTGIPGSSKASRKAHLHLPMSATIHQQQLEPSNGSASSSRSSSSWNADGTRKSWKEGAPAPRWAASRPVAVPGGGKEAGSRARRHPAAAKGSAQVAAAGQAAAEESGGSVAGSEDGSFVTAAGGSVRSFATALSTSSSSDGISAAGSPGTHPAAVGLAVGQSTSRHAVSAAEGGVADKDQGGTCSSGSHTPAEVPVVFSLTAPVTSTTAPVTHSAAPAAAAAPAGEEGMPGHDISPPGGANPEERRQQQEPRQGSQPEESMPAHASTASSASGASSAQDNEGTVTYEIEVLGIIPGIGPLVGRPILSSRAQDQGVQLSLKHLPHDGLSPTKRRPCRDWCFRHCSLNFLAPLRAAKGGLRWLGLRKSSRSRKDTEQHGDVAA